VIDQYFLYTHDAPTTSCFSGEIDSTVAKLYIIEAGPPHKPFQVREEIFWEGKSNLFGGNHVCDPWAYSLIRNN